MSIRSIAIATGLAALVLYGAYHHGGSVTAARYETKLSDMRADHKAIQAAQAAALAQAHDDARETEYEWARRMAAVDAKHHKELTDAKANAAATIDSLRADVISVRKRFTCPAAATSPAGQAGTHPGVDAGEAQRGLSRADVEFLLREADRADTLAVQLQALQDVVTGEAGHGQ